MAGLSRYGIIGMYISIVHTYVKHSFIKVTKFVKFATPQVFYSQVNVTIIVDIFEGVFHFNFFCKSFLTHEYYFQAQLYVKGNHQKNKRFEFKKLVGCLRPWKLELLANCHYSQS